MHLNPAKSFAATETFLIWKYLTPCCRGIRMLSAIYCISMCAQRYTENLHLGLFIEEAQVIR